MNAVRNINLSAEVRDALSGVTRGIERSAAFGLLGERIGALPADMTLPPATFPFQLGGGPTESAEFDEHGVSAEMRTEFASYCTRYAVLGMMASCEEYLQRLLLIARLAVLVVHQQGSVTGEGFKETREACRKEARQTSVDGLVPKILSAVRAESDTVVGLHWFRGVCSMSRCLTHRGGRIGPDDVGESQTLDVAWRKPVLELDSEPVVALPLQVQAGQLLSFGFTDEPHSWRVGEAISPTAEECQHIGLSLAIFCTELGNLLQRAMLPLFGVQPE